MSFILGLFIDILPANRVPSFEVKVPTTNSSPPTKRIWVSDIEDPFIPSSTNVIANASSEILSGI